MAKLSVGPWLAQLRLVPEVSLALTHSLLSSPHPCPPQEDFRSKVEDYIKRYAR